MSSITLLRDAGLSDASGSVITGFKVNSQINVPYGSLLVSNIRLFRNMFYIIDTGYLTGSSNWTIYNNIIFGILDGQNKSNNIIIQNNIFGNTNAGISGFNQPSVVIDHNLFINGNAFRDLRYAVITNNIITSSLGTQVMSGNVTQNTFNNNLSMSTNISPNAPTNSFLTGNTGAGNQVGVDPLFTSVTDFNNYNNTFNYRLQAGSPGKNAGTDATDLGIYGGVYPFPSGGAPGSGFDTSASPPIPQITSMNIQNASVVPGTLLKVTVQANVNN